MTRWTAAVPAADVFTDDQARRVQALRAAREIAESKTAGAAFGSSGSDVDIPSLLMVAEYIVTGIQP